MEKSVFYIQVFGFLNHQIYNHSGQFNNGMQVTQGAQHIVK
jgi:hypothetical protein